MNEIWKVENKKTLKTLLSRGRIGIVSGSDLLQMEIVPNYNLGREPMEGKSKCLEVSCSRVHSTLPTCISTEVVTFLYQCLPPISVYQSLIWSFKTWLSLSDYSDPDMREPSWPCTLTSSSCFCPRFPIIQLLATSRGWGWEGRVYGLLRTIDNLAVGCFVNILVNCHRL